MQSTGFFEPSGIKILVCLTLHGIPVVQDDRFQRMLKLFYSKYEEALLEKIVAAIKNAKQVLHYFNNTAQLAAIQNAQIRKTAFSLKICSCLPVV